MLSWDLIQYHAWKKVSSCCSIFVSISGILLPIVVHMSFFTLPNINARAFSLYFFGRQLKRYFSGKQFSRSLVQFAETSIFMV